LGSGEVAPRISLLISLLGVVGFISLDFFINLYWFRNPFNTKDRISLLISLWKIVNHEFTRINTKGAFDKPERCRWHRAESFPTTSPMEVFLGEGLTGRFNAEVILKPFLGLTISLMDLG
jgi:hypothetical protein